MNHFLNDITKHQLKADLPPFKVGDGVRVHIKVREGEKERVQVFAGIVIARKGYGIAECFTVRRISYGEGVEKVFPVNSPNIEKIEVDRESEVMRARLYYLRDRVGKKAVQVKEKRYEKPVAAAAAVASA
jgi:large subunit ribosomal protein L19